ncbi:ABC transporter permease subunit [Bartonella sp. HY329]|uniref:ABC transporter permease n=1 Tax=unclassified Bartonella TaxID=2645622 RepID=UPI0021C65EBC|nr:ABC transporter permease subunit [Bartonella sp. HY329]UXN10723.1 ABC transporter permease subunit [Bartonella sp. HY328]
MITSVNLLKQLPRLLMAAIIVALTIVTRLINMDFWPPEATLILIFALLGWFMQERINVVILVFIGLLFIINQGYWEDTMKTLSIVFWSCFICMLIGVSIGIYAAHHRHFYRFIQPILDLMQTIPSLVYLIPALVFFGVGMVPGMIATIIFVIPAPIRLTEIGIRTTPHILLEAGRAFGASPWQLLWKVELPFALPQIRVAMTQTIMLSLSMVVIATYVGGGGLGEAVVRALSTINISLGFEAGLVIVVIAVLLDRMFRPGKTR